MTGVQTCALPILMDSPDQGVYGLKGDVLYVSDDSLAISVASVGMTYSAVRMYNQLVGTFRQGSLEKGLMMIPGDGLPPRPQTPVPPYPYRTEPVVFESAMATLSGTLTLPTDGVDSDTPVVLMRERCQCESINIFHVRNEVGV